MSKQAQKNPQTVADKWANNLGQATQTMTQGVASVQTSPTSLAAMHADSYLAGIQHAVSSGKWARNLQAVSLQAWQQAMTTKGIPRVAGGANAAKGKMANFMGQLLPAVYSARANLPARGSLGQNIARMTQFVQAMAQFSYNKG